MRCFALAAATLILSQPAFADPRCGRYGMAEYSALRVTTTPAGRSITSRVFIGGGHIRSEAPGPHQGQMVTLTTPTLNTFFATAAEPRIAIRLPPPRRPDIPAESRRIREERGPGRNTLITELRDDDGRWREVERAVCRPDGVMLEARQAALLDGRPAVTAIRQTEIRLGPQDPALFRLPDGFRLVEAPPPRR